MDTSPSSTSSFSGCTEHSRHWGALGVGQGGQHSSGGAQPLQNRKRQLAANGGGRAVHQGCQAAGCAAAQLPHLPRRRLDVCKLRGVRVLWSR